MPVALITGGAGTLGVAVARRLMHDGWAVVLADVDIAGAEGAAKSLGGNASAVRMDVTNLGEVRAGVDGVVRRFGGIDAVIAAAGGRSGAGAGPFMEAPPKTWTQIVELHLTGVLNVYYSALQHMREKRSGSLIAISAVEAYRGLPESAAFSTAKGAVAVLTETLVRECQPHNIRVNSVISPTAESLARSGRNDGAIAVAEAIAFLVSDKASLTTGAAIDVSNGWALH
ncbi:MAG: SDR family NAD(P)-dependent oxidoreductase [Beijerinckiaceae bacterium]